MTPIVTSPSTDVSLVVPTRNRPGVLERLLRSVASQAGVEIEVVIIDDGSDTPVVTERVCAGVPDLADSVRVIRMEKPVGACAARNRGVEATHARHLLFLDDDTELVGPDLCERLVRFMDEQTGVGVVALAELNPDGSWGFNLGPAGQALEVARFFGCGAMFRRACFDQVGGFFEPLGYYYEEFELSMRVIAHDWKLVFLPDCRIVHHRDPSGRDARRISRLIGRNALLTIVARFPWWMVPAAIAAQLAKFSARSLRTSPLDPAGVFAVIGSCLKALASVLPERAALPMHALNRYKHLAKQPLPWCGAIA